MSGASRRLATAIALSLSHTPDHRQWPGFEVTDRTCCLSRSRARAKNSSSSIQKSRLKRALNLDEGERLVCILAVLVLHRVRRVLPSLIHHAAGIPRAVFDVAVAVHIAELVYPIERAERGRRQIAIQRIGSEPGHGLNEEHEKQRRGVDRPVVGCVRYL